MEKYVETTFKFIIVATVVLCLMYLLHTYQEESENEQRYIDTLTTCELLDYKAKNAVTVFQANNILLEKQNLILQGKCP